MDDGISSSQKSVSSLPLSQETYLLLFQELNNSLSHIMQHDFEEPLMDDTACNALVNNYYKTVHEVEENGDSDISNYYVENEIIEQTKPVSSLPASENWPGPYYFSVSFNSQAVKKGVSWIFSKDNNKLYVCKDLPCPVNFATSTFIMGEVIIRAMPLFSSPNNALDKVTRCLNHSAEDINKKIFEAEHLIRCESNSAIYEKDPLTGRHSVVVPYENPSAGQQYSTYLFKFMCFSSCSGGPNRRPLMVVFTLERQGEVIGRQTIDLKVCACPMRDYKSEHKELFGHLKENKPKKRPVKDQLLPPPIYKKPKEEISEYCVKTSDKNCYEFLKKMKRLYTISSQLAKLPPHVRRLMYTSSQSSSGEEVDDETLPK